MAGKPTYEELEQRVKELEKENLDRTKMERDLRIFKTAVESSINAIGITDLEGKLIYVNDSCVKMWGYNSEDEVLGRFLPEFFEGDGVIKTVKELREKGVASGEDVGKKKDGSLFFFQFTASIFKDAAGNPTLMFGSFFDITERKEIEEALRGSEACYRASQTEMICRFLPDGTITFVNDAYCHYFDKDRKELIGHKFMPFIPESDRDKVFKNIASLNPNTPRITHEHRVLTPNGEICWHKWTSLRESIEKGLKETQKCVVVLSPNYLANDGWSKAEFNSVFTREMLEKENIILPVWHHVSVQDVFEYSPSLADKVALNSNIGVKELARKLSKVIKSKNT